MKIYGLGEGLCGLADPHQGAKRNVITNSDFQAKNAPNMFTVAGSFGKTKHWQTGPE